ncbi:MAG: glycosyltransferase family 4 protein [Patescibacteria group bacterium]
MKKKLRIAQIAPLWIPVPPRTYGGIELMLYNLVEELERRGHEVTLFASGDSKISSKLISPIERAIWLQRDLRNPHAAIIKMLDMVRANCHSFDIIHNHFNFFMFPLVLYDKMPPILSTIHRPINGIYGETMRLFPKINFCTISKDAKNYAENIGIPIVDVVYNGINPELYEFNDNPQDYLLYLGRLNKEKGVVTALKIAREIRSHLIVAGNIVGPEEWTYFMQEIQPLLNSENINFVGQADFQEKIRLMKNAKALLFPIERREPFGLVMIEAMACGTPVIAFRKGSVPEVVVDGKTGFIVDNKEEMVEAIKKIDRIKRRDCREQVEKNFTLKQMVDKYEEIYKKLI